MSSLSIPVSSGDHVQGDPGAKCVLVEYGDYQCPYCGQAHPIVKRLQRHFGNDLQFVFRNFPLTEIHPHALSAAETAEFADERGKFWEMHDLIFENQQNLEMESLLGFATELGLPTEELLRALEMGTYEPRVDRDFQSGIRSGVNGTPSFFINGVRHDSSFEFEILKAALEQQLMATS